MGERAGTFTPRKATKGYWHRRLASIACQFVALFVLWLILSGRYEVKYLSFGVLSAGLVTFLTNDIFSAIFYCAEAKKTGIRLAFLKFMRFLAYMPWLLYRIIIANIQVAYLVLHPRMPIDPAFLQFSTQQKGKVAQVILANSITLTPGTVTVNLEDGEYLVHALVPGAAGDLLSGRMQNKVWAIFMEEGEPAPAISWAHSIQELAQ